MDSCRFQVQACSFSAYARRLLDSPKRPAQLSQRDDLLLLFFAQDITHGGEAMLAVANVRGVVTGRFSGGLHMAGFEVATHGRFWVAAEDLASQKAFFWEIEVGAVNMGDFWRLISVSSVPTFRQLNTTRVQYCVKNCPHFWKCDVATA